MSVRTVRLGEVCEFIRGVTFDKSEVTTTPKIGKIAILRAGNIGEELDAQNDLVWVPEALLDPEQHLRRNDIAICMSSGSPEVVGKTARAPSNLHASVGSFCGIIRPKKADQAAYLSFFFRSPAFYKHRDAIARGANIQNLRFSRFEEIQLEIPAEQNQIAGLLEQADRLRRTRRYALELSDTILPAAFIDLFGEPVANPKHWSMESIQSLVSDVRSGADLEPDDFIAEGFPVLHKGAIKPYGEVELDPKKKTFTHENFVKTHAKSVITRSYTAVTLRDLVPEGPSIGLVADLEHGPFDQYILAQGAYAFLVDKARLLPDYLVWLSNVPSFRKILRKIAVGSTQIHIRTPVYMELLIPVPPIELQREYRLQANKVRKIQLAQREALRQADHLFQSLLHRNFSPKSAV